MEGVCCAIFRIRSIFREISSSFGLTCKADALSHELPAHVAAAGCDDSSRAFGPRDQWVRELPTIVAFQHVEVAWIQRGRLDFDEDFARLWLWNFEQLFGIGDFAFCFILHSPHSTNHDIASGLRLITLTALYLRDITLRTKNLISHKDLFF